MPVGPTSGLSQPGRAPCGPSARVERGDVAPDTVSITADRSSSDIARNARSNRFNAARRVFASAHQATGGRPQPGELVSGSQAKVVNVENAPSRIRTVNLGLTPLIGAPSSP